MRFPHLPGDWSDLVIIGAATIEHGHASADQHIARRLAALGVPVLYVNPALAPRDIRDKPYLERVYNRPGLQLRTAGMAVLNAPLSYGAHRPGLRSVNEKILTSYLRKALSALQGTPRACLSVAREPMILRAAGERTSVFWARDDYTAEAKMKGRDPKAAAALAERHASVADLIIATTPAVADMWARKGHRTTLVPAGADLGAMSHIDTVTPAPEVYLPRPIVGFFGNLCERIDADLLLRIAQSDVSLLLVGHKSKTFDDDTMKSLQALPNVQWVGHQKPSRLPEFYAHLDVGIVPYTDNAFNRASSPLQLLEYLAAGLAVVSTPLPAARWLATRHVVTASGEEFIAQVHEAAKDPGGPAEVGARRAVATAHDWSLRAANILALLP